MGGRGEEKNLARIELFLRTSTYSPLGTSPTTGTSSLKAAVRPVYRTSTTSCSGTGNGSLFLNRALRSLIKKSIANAVEKMAKAAQLTAPRFERMLPQIWKTVPRTVEMPRACFMLEVLERERNNRG